MNSDTNDSTFPTSTSHPTGGLSSGAGASSSGASLSGMSGGGSSYAGGSSTPGMNADGTVHRVAQAAHQAVDKLEQTLGSSGSKVMSMQQEYGEMARDQVKANPLAAVGIAFGVGILFSKLFMR